MITAHLAPGNIPKPIPPGVWGQGLFEGHNPITPKVLETNKKDPNKEDWLGNAHWEAM